MSSNVDADSGVRLVYKNDPIVEAIVELAFVPDREWNITIPGRLYDRLQDEYPDPPKQREIVEAGLASDNDGVGTFTLNRKGARVVFGAGNKLLMVGPDVISLHSLKPYEGWGNFLPRVAKAIDSYVAVAQPKSIAKISLRYINRVNIPKEQFSLTEYFTITQALPDAFPTQMTSFVDRMELAYEDIPAQIAFTWATTKPAQEGQSSFVLDFDLHWIEECDIRDAIDHLKDLRRRQRAAFESVINEELRRIFNAD